MRLPGRTSRVLTVAASAAVLGGAVLAAVAFAADEQTSATLSSNVAAPTEVVIGNNAFTINVWATGNLPTGPSGSPNSGAATVVNKYTMATNGTITPSANAADVTNLTFNPGFNYTSGCDGPPDPQGCASNPFVVNATLVVAAGTPANTTGTLLVSNTGSSGLTADGTPANGFVKVKAATNQSPTVKTEAADALGTEGDTLTTSGAFEDLDGDPLTLSADNGTVGTFTPGASGTWTWSLPTNDDVASGTITVTANDGKGG